MRPWFDAHRPACRQRERATCWRASGSPQAVAAGVDDLPSLAAGGVRAGTIFTEANGNDAVAYPASDAEAAHAAGARQLEWYRQWAADRVIAMGPGADGACAATFSSVRIRCGVRTRHNWVERGVVAIGLTWARGSRHATGNSAPSCESPVGLTEQRKMVREMDRLGVIRHLAPRTGP
jgi:hypothetical protein